MNKEEEADCVVCKHYGIRNPPCGHTCKIKQRDFDGPGRPDWCPGFEVYVEERS